jgi:hypothetical protein
VHGIPRIPDHSFVNSLKNKYITRDEVRNVAPHESRLSQRSSQSVGKGKDVPTTRSSSQSHPVSLFPTLLLCSGPCEPVLSVCRD